MGPAVDTGTPADEASLLNDRDAWLQLMDLEKAKKKQRRPKTDQMPFFIGEIIELDRPRLRQDRPHTPSAPSLLVQTFEGTLTDVNDSFAIVEFEMGERRELRRFSRAELRAPGLRVGDVVQLRCELVPAPPVPPLSGAELRQWERCYADLALAQAKTRLAKSLEDQP